MSNMPQKRVSVFLGIIETYFIPILTAVIYCMRDPVCSQRSVIKSTAFGRRVDNDAYPSLRRRTDTEGSRRGGSQELQNFTA